MLNREVKLLLVNFIFITGTLFSLEFIFSHISESPFKSERSKKFEFGDPQKSNQGYIDINNRNLLWFIHVTDTQFVWYDSDQIAYFYQFLNESYKEIDPLFIYNTGDLVNANNGTNQDLEEWKRYQKALDENKMNSSIYMDVIGNHDAVNDPEYSYFLNYSMMGRNYNVTQYSFNRSFSFGDYAFIGLNTAKESYNLFESSFFGYLDKKELDWYENELEKYKYFDRIFIFGHHPTYTPPLFTIISELSSSGKLFNDLNKEYNVFCYLSGHSPTNSFHNINNLFSIRTKNFDQNNGTYRIISLDNNQLSTSIEYVGRWPQGIITHPPREEFKTDDSNGRLKKIRVLAWDPKGIISVKCGLFDIKGENQLTEWQLLENLTKTGTLYEGDLDFAYSGKFLIKVEIKGGSGESIKEIVITLKNITLKNNLYFEFVLITILLCIALASLVSIFRRYLLPYINKAINAKRHFSIRKIVLNKKNFKIRRFVKKIFLFC